MEENGETKKQLVAELLLVDLALLHNLFDLVTLFVFIIRRLIIVVVVVVLRFFCLFICLFVCLFVCRPENSNSTYFLCP